MGVNHLEEDELEFSERTKRNLEQSGKDLIEGRTVSLAEVRG